MDPLLYKVLHIFGVLLAFTALGGMTLQALTSREKGGSKLAGTSGIKGNIAYMKPSNESCR